MSGGDSDPVEVEIDRLGRLGDGLAAPDAADALRNVAVPGALPGERVRIAPLDDGVRLIEIVRDSPHRVAPPCPNADICGGCQLQHAAPSLLADWRRSQIAGALAAHGLETEIAETVSAPRASRRRASLTATRTKRGVLLGFRERRSHAIAAIDGCLVLRPDIMAALPALADLAAIAAPRKRAIRLKVAAFDEGLDVAVEEGKALDLDLRAAAAAWAEASDVARLTWDGEGVALRRPPTIVFGPARVAPPPGAFLQATAEGEATLVAEALAGLDGARRIADLFAGCGTFTLPLSARADVLAVDADASAIKALDQGWRRAEGVRRVAAVARDLFRRPMTAEELKGVDAALFDPPRAGAAAQTAELARAGLGVVVGVSCNPATFARDARLLVDAGFRLDRVAPVDQFLWSPHVELVGVFRR